MNKKNMFLMMLALAAPVAGSAGDISTNAYRGSMPMSAMVLNPDTSNPYSWGQWLVGGVVVGAGAGILAHDFWQTVGADETVENGDAALKAADQVTALNHYVAALRKHEERWIKPHDGRIFRTKITAAITSLLLDCNPETPSDNVCPVVSADVQPDERAMYTVLYALDQLMQPRGLPVFLNQDEHAVFGDFLSPFMQASLYRFLSNAYGKCHNDAQRVQLQKVLCGLITRGLALEQIFDAIKAGNLQDDFITDALMKTVHRATTYSTMTQQKCVALHMMKLWVEAGLPLRRAEYYLSNDLLSSPCRELRNAAIDVKEAIMRNDTRSKLVKIADRLRNTLEYSGRCCNNVVAAAAPLMVVAALAILVGKGFSRMHAASCGPALGHSCFR